MSGEEGRQLSRRERRGRQFAVGEHLAAIDDAPVRMRVADIEAEKGHRRDGGKR